MSTWPPQTWTWTCSDDLLTPGLPCWAVHSRNEATQAWSCMHGDLELNSTSIFGLFKVHFKCNFPASLCFVSCLVMKSESRTWGNLFLSRLNRLATACSNIGLPLYKLCQSGHKNRKWTYDGNFDFDFCFFVHQTFPVFEMLNVFADVWAAAHVS